MVAAILLLAAIVYLLNILSVPVAILIWTVIIVFCLRGIVNGLEKRHINRGLGTTIAYVIMALVLALIGFLAVLAYVRPERPVQRLGQQPAPLC